MEPVLMLLIVHPNLEDALIDLLLLQSEITGFSSQVIYGHGEHSHALSLVEQVTGKQKRLQFTVYAKGTVCDTLIKTIKDQFDGAEIHYFILPVLAAGRC